MSTLTIDSRFRGPPHSGNGGYVAGMLARELGGSGCEVTLFRPPPLDRPLEVKPDGAAVHLLDEDQLVASALPADVDLAGPPAPSLEEARTASARFTGFADHVFPGCFVCGPERADGDGLRIFPGRTAGKIVAAPWTPPADLCPAGAPMPPELVWAALDCPGYFAVQHRSGPAVLGRLAVRIDGEASCQEPLIVAGWHIESSGRKHRAGTALYAGRRPVALGLAVWVSLRTEVEPPPES